MIASVNAIVIDMEVAPEVCNTAYAHEMMTSMIVAYRSIMIEKEI